MLYSNSLKVLTTIALVFYFFWIVSVFIARYRQIKTHKMTLSEVFEYFIADITRDGAWFMYFLACLGAASMPTFIHFVFFVI
jgi:hypothetical protein